MLKITQVFCFITSPLTTRCAQHAALMYIDSRSFSHHSLTSRNWNNGHISFPQDILIFSFLAEGILAPSTNSTLNIIKISILGWQANRVNIPSERHRIHQNQQSNVVMQSCFIEPCMNDNVLNSMMRVCKQLEWIFSVPFASANDERWFIFTMDTMSGCESRLYFNLNFKKYFVRSWNFPSGISHWVVRGISVSAPPPPSVSSSRTPNTKIRKY